MVLRRPMRATRAKLLAAAVQRVASGPAPAPPPAPSFAVAEGGTLTTLRNGSVTLATGVAGGTTYYVSPDLLPGQSLQLSGGTVSVVSDSTTPTVDASAGTVKNAVSDRDHAFVVMDQPLAWGRLIRGGELGSGGSVIGEYGYGFAKQIWDGIRNDSRDGDIFEISPGAVAPNLTQGSGVPNFYLDAYALVVPTSITIRGMGGARWRIFPDTLTPADTGNIWGIVTLGPDEITGSGWDYTPGVPGSQRKTIVIQDFECDNYGSQGCVSIRGGAETAADASHMPVSVTLRNFKIGKRLGYTGGHCIGGAAENLTLEDGHVYDGGDGSGLEHNMYISAKNMTLKGIRTSRSRGWTGSLEYLGAPGSVTTLEGHLAKLTAQTGVIEGCCFDAAWVADHSLMLQLKGGGNWTVRGNVFVDSYSPNVANGAITMVREYSAEYSVYNFFPWTGDLGNSLLFEKNVVVLHYPRPIIWFPAQDADTPTSTAMRPASGGSWTVNQRLASLTVRDNVAMVRAASRPFMLSGFPGASNAMWINQDPNAGATWSARGNEEVPYVATEEGFLNRELKMYQLASGPVSGATNTGNVPRFAWPHGWVNVADAYKGLG